MAKPPRQPKAKPRRLSRTARAPLLKARQPLRQRIRRVPMPLKLPGTPLPSEVSLMMSLLRRYLIAGLLIWLPLGVTLLVIKLLVDMMDNTLLLLPEHYQPDALLGFHLPGLGVVLSITIILVTGVVVANLFGRRLVLIWEAILGRIPLVRSIYAGTKQIAETLFSPNGQSFRKVVLIEYPRRGLWTLAFQTGNGVGEAQTRTREEEHTSELQSPLQLLF